jgi:hypothetical protein
VCEDCHVDAEAVPSSIENSPAPTATADDGTPNEVQADSNGGGTPDWVQGGSSDGGDEAITP